MTITDTITYVKLSQGLMMDKELPTKTLEVVKVHRETRKAILADLRPVAGLSDHCYRCDQPLKEDSSQKLGYGPDCITNFDVSRPAPHEEDVWIEAVLETITDNLYTEQWVPKVFVHNFESEIDDTISVWFEDDGSVNGKFFMKTPYELKEKCKDVSGTRWREAADGKKYWRCDASPDTARDILEVFEGYEVKTSPEFDRFARTYNDRSKIKDADNLPDIPLTKSEPWEHQKRAFHFAQGLPGVMLDCGMGTGKTKMTLDIISNDDSARWVLVIAPKKVCKTNGGWGEQLQAHCAKDYEALILGPGTSVEHKAHMLMQFRENAPDDGKLRFVITNYEATWRPPLGPWFVKDRQPAITSKRKDQRVAGILEAIPWDYVACDESHRIKSHSSKQSLMAARVGQRTDHRFCLSGTPMGESPLDVFGQYRFLDPAIYGDNWWAFRNKFALTEKRVVGKGEKKHEIDMVVGIKNKDILYKKFSRIAFTVGEEVLDLPEYHHVFRRFDLSPEAQKVYADLYTNMKTEFRDGSLSPANGAVRMMRLQQVSSGFARLDKKGDPVYDENREARTTRVDSGKQEELLEVLEDIGPREPVVVFCWFHEDLDIVHETAKKLGYKSYEMSGRGRDERDAWNEAGRGVLAVQTQSGAEGVNDLVQARYGIYFTIGTSNLKYEQSLKRLHRPGQKNQVTFIHLIANGFNGFDKDGEEVKFDSADERSYQTLSNKKNLIDSVKQMAKGE